jgi:hypothetical protein
MIDLMSDKRQILTAIGDVACTLDVQGLPIVVSHGDPALFSKREFMRRGINQHTLERICDGEPGRALKSAKCLGVI